MDLSNNLDIIILAVVVISALIALSRGLVKEVLSIVGWVLATCAVIYLLPLVMPFATEHIGSGILAGVISSLCILILFFIIWIYSTSEVIGKIRTSKLNGMDRLLGLFFGVARAFLLVILFYILISWIIPADKQSPTLVNSKYFQIAGKFAHPIEEMIPEETLKLIKEGAKTISMDGKKEEKSAKDKEEETKQKQPDEVELLFEKLAQPQIKKILSTHKNSDKNSIKENFKGYDANERNNMDRLIDNVE